MRIALSTSRIPLVAMALTLAAPCARAQQEPAMIPTALATAMLGGFGSRTGMRPHFTVDQPPVGWPAALVPVAPWKVVGGFEFGPLRITMFEGPRNRDLVAEYAAILTRAGYGETILSDDVRGGFVTDKRPRLYCSASDLVSIIPADSTAMTRSLLVQYVRGDPGHACASTRTVEQRAGLDVPSLQPPAGLRTLSFSNGWSTNSIDQTMQIDGAMGAPELLDYYTRLLVAAGWTAAGQPLVGSGTGVQPLSTHDKDGTRWEGLIMVITTGGQRNLMLRMAKPTP